MSIYESNGLFDASIPGIMCVQYNGGYLQYIGYPGVGGGGLSGTRVGGFHDCLWWANKNKLGDVQQSTLFRTMYSCFLEIQVVP